MVVRSRTIGFFSGCDLFSFARRENRGCACFAKINERFAQSPSKEGNIDEEFGSFGNVGPCLFNFRQRVGERAKYFDGGRRRPRHHVFRDGLQRWQPRRSSIRQGRQHVCARQHYSDASEGNVATNVVSVYAGNGTLGFSGDGLLATNAQMNEPSGMCIDPATGIFSSPTQTTRSFAK